MKDLDEAEYFRLREKQELDASNRASDAHTRRLHWEMAQQYANKAREQEIQA